MSKTSTKQIKITASATTVEYGKFQGAPIFSIKQGNFNSVSFGIKKAGIILDNLGVIQQWINGEDILPTDIIRIGEFKGSSTLGFFEKLPVSGNQRFLDPRTDKPIFNAGATKYKHIMAHLDELRIWYRKQTGEEAEQISTPVTQDTPKKRVLRLLVKKQVQESASLKPVQELPQEEQEQQDEKSEISQDQKTQDQETHAPPDPELIESATSELEPIQEHSQEQPATQEEESQVHQVHQVVVTQKLLEAIMPREEAIKTWDLLSKVHVYDGTQYRTDDTTYFN